MEKYYFMHREKCTTNGTFDKGIEVKQTFEAAKQSYHAYLGAYAYGQNADVIYVSCMITNLYGTPLMSEVWIKPGEEPEPEEV